MADRRTTHRAAGEHAAAGTTHRAAGEHTAAALLADLERRLASSGVERVRARAEARDIIAAVAGESRFWATLHPDAELTASQVAEARLAVQRRAAGAPFAYAVRRAPFRHLTLHVDERVLIPRQETEGLVQAVLERLRTRGGVAIDVGTGSGAIALALAQEWNFDRVIATDVSVDALTVARRNVEHLSHELRCPVELRSGSLLDPVRGVRARAVVSNPPYIAYEEIETLPPGVRNWEPPHALLAAGGGMQVTLAIIREAATVLEPGGVLALEVDCRRASLAAEAAAASPDYESVEVVLDLAGRERYLLAVRRSHEGKGRC